MAWEVKKLKDIQSITFMRGNGLKKSLLSNDGKYKCILYGELYTKYKNPIIKVIKSKTDFKGNRLSKKGDLLIPGTTTADAFGIAIARSLDEDDVILGGDINILRTNNEELLSDFLSYFINGPAKRELASYATGTNIMHLSNKKIQNIEVPIPPLPIQKQIVKILDKAFEKISKAKENSEQNLKNAKEVFDSYLQSVFENIREECSTEKLGQLCKFVRGPFGGSLKKSYFKPSGFAVYEQQHAINDQFEKIRYFIDENKFEEMKRFELKRGDLIMSCSGTMGKIAIVPKNILQGIINQALLKLTPNDKIDILFLKIWMESQDFQNQLSKFTKGAAIKNVASVKILKGIITPLPRLDKQKEIINKIEVFTKETNKLSEIYTQKLLSLEELKQSILQKAFNGELTKVLA